MATLNINIINPTIDLISEVTEQSNDCTSIFEFTVKTIPNSTIRISGNPDKGGYEDYLFQRKNLSNGIWYRWYENSNLTLGSGETKVRVVMENYSTTNVMGVVDTCNTLDIVISDITNNKSETREFTRCGGIIPCGNVEDPIANDDEYEVIKGGVKNLPILNNDDAGSSYTNLDITIESQPTYGTIEILDTGEVKYTHVGDTLTSDSFTYSVTNAADKKSNIATVIIDIFEKQIDTNTRLNIFFDATNSMNSTLPILQYMRDNELELALEEYYESVDDYRSKVNVYEFSGEKMLLALRDYLNPSGKTITIVVQNEANPVYHGFFNANNWSINDARTPSFNDDMSVFRRDALSLGDSYNGIVFQVKDAGEGEFKTLLEAMESGSGQYYGDNGFSNVDNVKVVYDMLEGAEFANTQEGSEYYTQQIINVLEDLGFNV